MSTPGTMAIRVRPVTIAVLLLALVTTGHAAESFTLEESVEDARPRQVTMQVDILGKVQTSAGPGQTADLELRARQLQLSRTPAHRGGA